MEPPKENRFEMFTGIEQILIQINSENYKKYQNKLPVQK